MTYTLKRYLTYQDYLDNYPEKDGDYRLLSTGEVIQLPPESDKNVRFATRLFVHLILLPGLTDLVRKNDTDLEVKPVGDKCLNRKPDVMVLRPEHIALLDATNYSAIRIGMPPPVFVAEMVSPGNENSSNYKRDYVWKREQYEWWGIEEYWIMDRQRGKVTVLLLEEGTYSETIYRGNDVIQSASFPALSIRASDVLI